MKVILWLKAAISMCIFTIALPGISKAQDLSVYQWEKRPVIVFTSRDTHRSYAEQMRILNGAKADLEERDVVVLVDAKPTPPSSLRLEFLPEDFLFVLVGKDGGVKLRSEDPVSINELNALIDGMPMRKREMQEN